MKELPGKAARLLQARRAGLPVPPLAVLDGPAAIDAVKFDGPYAVRSAFAAEDGLQDSKAGAYLTLLDVPTHGLREAAEAVWASGPDGAAKRILVMRMVRASVAGVAFTEQDFEDDLVNWTQGLGDRLVSGEVPGETVDLAKLSPGESPDQTEWRGRLQALLRNVRHTFGNQDWDVEWADDGTVCWLLQVRPVTRFTVRNETFTLANHKEILPDLPSRLMASLIQACAPNLFGYYRDFDPTLPKRRLFIETFHGRPLINLSLMTDMMRHWGLPTRLVTDSIGGGQGVDVPLRPRRLVRKIPVLLRMALAQAGAAKSAERVSAGWEAVLQTRFETWSDWSNAAQRVYTELVREMFSLTAATSSPLSLLRRTGVLAELSARHSTAGTRMFVELEALRSRVASEPTWQTPLSQGVVPESEEFGDLWEAWLERWGHRGVYESDLSRPRFRESPGDLLRSLVRPPSDEGELPPRTLKGRLLSPVWAAARRPMDAREELRNAAMRVFAHLRAEALRMGGDWVWDLDLQELESLSPSQQPDPQSLQTYRSERARLAQVRLPDLLPRFGNPHDAPPPGEWRGIPLTPGIRSGRAWVLREPSLDLPEGYDPQSTILVARSVDIGWVPTFGLVAGVVVETGGDLSHGSIILREIGLPAITNVAQATSIPPGTPLTLDATTGTVHHRTLAD